MLKANANIRCEWSVACEEKALRLNNSQVLNQIIECLDHYT